MDAECFVLSLWKPVGLADCTDAGKQSRLLTPRGRIRGTACAIGSAFTLYVCLCLPYVLFVSLSLTLSSLFPLYFLLREKQKVWQNKEKQKRLLCRVALRAPQLHQCHIEIRPLNSPSVVAAPEVSGSGGIFVLFDMCHVSERQ